MTKPNKPTIKKPRKPRDTTYYRMEPWGCDIGSNDCWPLSMDKASMRKLRTWLGSAIKYLEHQKKGRKK